MNKEVNTIVITNPQLKSNLEELEGKIKQFFYLVSSEVNSTEHNLDCGEIHFIAEVKDAYAYANDGNTRVPGRDYRFYWVVSLEGKDLNDVNPNYIGKGYEENILYFKYEVNERVSDGRLRGPFVSLYYIRDNRVCFDTDATSRGYHVCNSNFLKLDHNNDNYELASIVNIKNAAECIELISRDARRMLLMTKLEAKNNLVKEGCTPVNSSLQE